MDKAGVKVIGVRRGTDAPAGKGAGAGASRTFVAQKAGGAISVVGVNPGGGPRDGASSGGLRPLAFLRGVCRVGAVRREGAARDMGCGATRGVVEVVASRVAIASIVSARAEAPIPFGRAASVRPLGAPVRAA